MTIRLLKIAAPVKAPLAAAAIASIVGNLSHMGLIDVYKRQHLRQDGDHDELYFRDYMRDYPDAAKEYETLKLGLWKQYEHCLLYTSTYLCEPVVVTIDNYKEMLIESGYYTEDQVK